jgi:uncharacterized membrane protein
MNRNILKSIGAVLAGFLTVFILSVATDALLEYIGVLPAQTEGLFDTKLLVLALAYRSLYAMLGGYVTARLAPSNTMRHVAILGVLGTIGGIVGIFVGWNMSDHWYPIALAVTAFPLVWVGGTFVKEK